MVWFLGPADRRRELKPFLNAELAEDTEDSLPQKSQKAQKRKRLWVGRTVPGEPGLGLETVAGVADPGPYRGLLTTNGFTNVNPLEVNAD
jgi:hypothetical protein